MKDGPEKYHDILKDRADRLAHLIYKITRKLPKDERYGATSQIRRAALSVILNYVEGFARNRKKMFKSFLEISYASLQETQYLIQFIFDENWISQSDYIEAKQLADKVSGMLWGIIAKLK